MAENYAETYVAWKRDPAGFWEAAAKAITWEKPFDRVLDRSQTPSARWFVGGRLNVCYNAVDRHVEAGRGARTALIYDSAMTGTKQRFSFADLQREVARTAGMIRAAGVEKGDRVVLYMPMVPEAVIAMLACARLGAIHSVVFGGFAARELGVRIDDAQPKLILSASCGLEPGRTVEYKPLLDKALEMASHKPARCIILQRDVHPCTLTPGRDLDWKEALAEAKPTECVAVEATDPLYILYTSGTTGKPKGVVRDSGGYAVALAWSMQAIYGMAPGEVYWSASDIGWVVGHSYIVYGPLIAGCATVLYEGKPVGTPDAGAFWRVIQEYGVKALFTAPTALRAIKREDPDARKLRDYDIASLSALYLAGERADPDTVKWAQTHLQRPVIDHWWQTETGWAIVSNFMGLETLPIKPGSSSVPVPGYDVQVLGSDGRPVSANESGAIVVRLPLPPGCLPTLWNNDEGFVRAYLADHPGYYTTADAGFIDEDGYVHIMSRTDDIINVAGHRLSTGEIEAVIASHPSVAECAVIGVADPIKGAVPLGLVVLKAGVTDSEEAVAQSVVAKVREEIGPVAAFKTAYVVKRLPKTRSGKVLRGTMRKIADGHAYDVPATIDDPASLDEIGAVLGDKA
jgi:propionyl-CoA synthetase